jgi:putrescine aminotransferase
MGATIVTKEVAKSMEFMFSQYSTYGWHPLSVEASLAFLGYFLKRKIEIFKHADEVSRYFEKRLKQMKFKHPAEIRVVGMAMGIEFKQENYNVEIVNKCLEKGLFIDVLLGPVITIFPPLTMSMEVAKEGLDIFESCL